MRRRDFLKVIGSTAAGVALSRFFVPKKAVAQEKEFMAILVDTTRCIGCRSCEFACASAHNLPEPSQDPSVFEKIRKMTTTQWTVVNRYNTEKGEVFVKKQCMHCNTPACVAACLVKAMKKHEEGQVTWEENCMGCRLCMYSCPFDVPKFEYDSPKPTIQKCNMCFDRYITGKIPACVEVCPQEALIFGTRRELLLEAKRRITAKPDSYVPHIYGEKEVGGTCYLYLAAVPFKKIGFRVDLENKPLPEYTTGFLYSVPFVLVLWPLFLLGLNRLTKKE
ncbi:MAG: 4Fe-4S dicluster domain-containing protein [Desulfobacterota bacterium]|nr:4Fe-4S dicluster domain-containing protein [Thermodesulfobacteriota bacterium]MDW8001430.1 4Fe-4S dicluster domain-containing protein [Deltaproteobacteria bacterium]